MLPSDKYIICLSIFISNIYLINNCVVIILFYIQSIFKNNFTAIINK